MAYFIDCGESNDNCQLDVCCGLPLVNFFSVACFSRSWCCSCHLHAFPQSDTEWGEQEQEQEQEQKQDDWARGRWRWTESQPGHQPGNYAVKYVATAREKQNTPQNKRSEKEPSQDYTKICMYFRRLRKYDRLTHQTSCQEGGGIVGRPYAKTCNLATRPHVESPQESRRVREVSGGCEPGACYKCKRNVKNFQLPSSGISFAILNGKHSGNEEFLHPKPLAVAALTILALR